MITRISRRGVMAAVAFALLFAGCTAAFAQSALTKDKVTLTMVAGREPVQKNLGDMQLFKDLERLTNVHVEWNIIPSQSFDEKKQLILASGDLPDAFFGTSGGAMSDSDLLKYGPDGLFIPLEKYVDGSTVNLKKIFADRPEFRRISTSPDKHIYSLPFIQENIANTVYTKMHINTAWLKKLGLAVPKTTDDLYKDLVAFKNQDPNGNGKKDEIPLSFVNKDNNSGLYGLFGSFGSLDCPNHLMVKDKKVVITATMSEYKKAIQFFAKLYKEGLMDNEVFTQDYSQYTSKGQAADSTYGMVFSWTGTDVVGADRYAKEFSPLTALKGPDGIQMWPSRGATVWRGFFTVTNKDKYPELTMKWIDQIYDWKESLQMQFGPIGKNFKEAANGKLEMLDPPAGVSSNEFRFSDAPGLPPSAILSETFTNKLILNQKMNNDYALYLLYKPYIGNNYYPSAMMTSAQNEIASAIGTDIWNYVDTMQAKWISGASSVDKDWDTYLAELKKMKIDDLLSVYQAAYDSFMGQ